MELELITQVDPKEFGLEESKVKTIEDAFMPKVTEREALKVQYEELITQELTNNLSKDAKVLRLKLVKVRTGIADVHTTQKSFFLAAGKFVDAWKNKETLPVTQMEEKLKGIEQHFEKVEAERKHKLISERKDKLTKYDETGEFIDLANMPNEDFDKYLNTVKSTFEAKIQAELDAEKQRQAELKRIEDERIAKEKADKIERERIEKENEKLKKDAQERERLAKIDADKRAKIEADRKAKEELLNKAGKARQEMLFEIGFNLDFESCKGMEADFWTEFYREKNDAYQKEQNRIFLEKMKEESKLKAERKEKDRIANELKAKKEAEEKAEQERLAKIQTDLNKGDTAKVQDLINDIEALKTKYEFKAKKNQKMYTGATQLFDKTIEYIRNK